MATIEAKEGWLLGEFDGWSSESRVLTKLVSGSSAHLGTEYDITTVLVEAGKGSTRVTVYPGLRPLFVETSGIVSAIPMLDSQKPKIMEFELKGVGAFVQISQSERVLVVRNERR